MIDAVERNRDRIADLCRRHGVKRLDLFGSAAGGDFDAAESDVDFFYEFDPGNSGSVADRFFGLLDDLEALFGRSVDLVSAKDARNRCFLAVANQHRVALYAA